MTKGLTCGLVEGAAGDAVTVDMRAFRTRQLTGVEAGGGDVNRHSIWTRRLC
ncbi:hypothetical protein PFLmoz3_02532 [Pseudomonas fluorescens]|uniref:Uncharacterized protein n=1 Tax=Pseudomonas fluorescens TaxID=294 RepID=A0A120G7V0_PSEFL|nr:hypothetical protein PFLmoz3_02532 [Pseudomonas fluorescens]